jgi:hypothetical protein
MLNEDPDGWLGGRDGSVFCNVELNMCNLKAVGFDMDFTLAQYNEAFDLLAFEGAKEKLHTQARLHRCFSKKRPEEAAGRVFMIFFMFINYAILQIAELSNVRM